VDTHAVSFPQDRAAGLTRPTRPPRVPAGTEGGVAETGTTVLLSSHLLADLKRVCDYLIVLYAAQVQLVGTVEDLVAEHRQLVGPPRE
jgi:hypothetical protein